MTTTVCKWCKTTELVFDNAFKSKTGKMIPLDKQSGLPHNCSENPYAKQQAQQAQSRGTNSATQAQQAQSAGTNSSKMTLEILYSKVEEVSSKVDRLLNLVSHFSKT